MKNDNPRFFAAAVKGTVVTSAAVFLALAALALGGCRHEPQKAFAPPGVAPSHVGAVATKEGGQEKVEKIPPKPGQQASASQPSPVDEQKKIDEANKAKMPADWPKIVPIISNTTIERISYDAKKGRGSMLLSSKQSRENIVDFYKKHFLSLGWAQKPGPPYSAATVLQFSKGDPKKGGSSIVLFVSEDAINHVNLIDSTFQIAK